MKISIQVSLNAGVAEAPSAAQQLIEQVALAVASGKTEGTIETRFGSVTFKAEAPKGK